MDKPEALRLADDVELNHKYCPVDVLHEAAAELRRQHEEITQLRHGAAATNLCIVGLVSQRDALLEVLKGMLLRDERNTCRHEETHRGGAIWEICDSCGAMWADDQGGKPEWEDPKEWTQARAAIKAVEETK
jgi:hypothetical protein